MTTTNKKTVAGPWRAHSYNLVGECDGYRFPCGSNGPLFYVSNRENGKVAWTDDDLQWQGCRECAELMAAQRNRNLMRKQATAPQA